MKLRQGRDGSDLDIVQPGVTRLGLPCLFYQPGQEFLVDTVLQQKARAGHAGLACRREDAGNDAVDRLFQVGIIEHDVGRFSTQLQ
ncbi:hypothetical protein D3C87_1850980 [compost metagenome]